MKALINKFFTNTACREFLILVIPFLLWVFCFRDFFSGHVLLQQDAVSYADNIKYYTDNLSKGVFPLWNPDWFNGAPYHFFLRRIGDVNPLLFLIILLKWVGISGANAYLLFLGAYYFLAGWGFYLITRILLSGRLFAFTAYCLFLFSSWGSEIFYNYIIIIYVPVVWFFYFLLSFCRTPKKVYFLGACFCVGLILTTYIPFFFLTILALFTVLFFLFYGNVFIDLLKRSFTFFLKNKIFTCLCIVFLLVSCVPATVFYKESKSGEFVLPDRHSGADTSLPIAVGLLNVASGDIINHGFFDRVFSDHPHLDMGDIYIPYVFFIVLLAATFGRVNKLIFFLLFNILGLSLISITSASGVHRFLYDHIIFFKLIRNIYYFFWLSILPMAILLSVTAFQSLLKTIDNSSRKTSWLVYITICHVIFIAFLYRQQEVLDGAWIAVFISMIFFLVYCRCEEKTSIPVGFCAVLLAVFIQSVQVYGFLGDRMYQIQQDSLHFSLTHQNPKKEKMGVYYATRWFDILVNYIDPQVLDDYRNHPFIIYDNIVPYVDAPQFLKSFESSVALNTNIAYVSKFESGPEDWKSNPYVSPQAEDDPVLSGKLSVLSHDANTWKIKTHLTRSQFLVINDNYNNDWHAFINGRPARLLRANVSFKGLWVPAGDSQLVLRFSKPWVYAAHIALMVLFAGIFLYLLVLFKKDRTVLHGDA